jgi:hypothetical protein
MPWVHASIFLFQMMEIAYKWKMQKQAEEQKANEQQSESSKDQAQSPDGNED